MGKFEEFLEKAGILNPENPDDLIEEIEGKKQSPKANKQPTAISTTIPANSNSATPTETAQIATDIIEQAYRNLPEETGEVYIAEQLAKNFSMLPANQLPEVIRNTLTTMGKNVETMQQSVIIRQKAVFQAYDHLLAITNGEIGNLQKIVAECEERIKDCKQEQLDKQNALAQARQDVNVENERLKEIYKLLGGK